jgi:hypothetical protein
MGYWKSAGLVEAIGWLLILIGIGAIIEGYHGHTLWSSLNSYFSSSPSVTTGTTGTTG